MTKYRPNPQGLAVGLVLERNGAVAPKTVFILQALEEP